MMDQCILFIHSSVNRDSVCQVISEKNWERQHLHVCHTETVIGIKRTEAEIRV